jgi:hypothetical protein
MRCDPRSSIPWALAIIAIGAYCSGCGGLAPGHLGGGGGGGNPPPTHGTARIQGIVVDAANPAQRIAGATIRVAQAQQTSDALGAFAFTHLNAGTVVLAVSFPPEMGYRAMQIAVSTASGKLTQVTVAAVPEGINSPDSVSISPSSVQVDLGEQVTFTLTVTALGLPSVCRPSLSILGGIGSVTPTGVFTATAKGTGSLTASVGTASATATITVVAPTGPHLGTLSVSPSTLSADGGKVRIAVTATDGAGIERIVALIESPDGSREPVALGLEAGTLTDGTWAKEIRVPQNSNPTDPQGHQLPQTYNVKVTARDARGKQAVSPPGEQWVIITVAGLEPPPPPPGG